MKLCCFRASAVVGEDNYKDNALNDGIEELEQKPVAQGLSGVVVVPSRAPSRASGFSGQLITTASPEDVRVEVSPGSPQERKRVWVDLLSSAQQLRHPSGKRLDVAGTFAHDAQGARHIDKSTLRLPQGCGLLPIQELNRLCDASSDPVVVLLLDRTTRRAVRTQKVPSPLLVDINLEALFAGVIGYGVSPGGAQGAGSPVVEDLDPSSGVSVQGTLTLLQSAYYKAEALRLSVHHCNAATQAVLGCPGNAEYEGLLADLLGSEPHLGAVIHDCCLGSLDGVSAPASQLLVNHPLPGTPVRVVMPITVQPVLVRVRPQLSQHILTSPAAAIAAAVAAGGGGAVAGASEGCAAVALVIQYNMSAGVRTTLQQQHRVYAMMAGLPGIVTLFTLRGRVLYQNTASIRYMGLRQDPSLFEGVSSTHPDHQRDSRGLSLGSILRQMFALSSEQMDEMLEEAALGKTWKGIVRVPPLLSPIVDPGPAAAVGRGTRASAYASSTSQTQHLSTWERLGAGLTSGNGTHRARLAHASTVGDPPSDSDVVDLAKALLTNNTNNTNNTTDDERNAGPPRAPDISRIRSVMQLSGTNRPVTAAAGPPRRVNTATGGSGSTADSQMLLAVGSSGGGSFNKTRLGTPGGAQDSASQSRFKAQAAATSEHGSHEASSTGFNIMQASLSPTGHDRPPPTAPQLGGSGPGMVQPGFIPRVGSSARMSGHALLATLVESGTLVMEGMEHVSAATGGGAAAAVEGDSRVRLTDAARRSIVRRRSALKLTVAEAETDPLSTSTWGLLEGARHRPESKSFSVRHNPSAFSTARFGRQQTDQSMNAPSPEAAGDAAARPRRATSAAIAVARSSSSKRRAPSRLISFLASRNISGSISAGLSRTAVATAAMFSSPAAEAAPQVPAGTARKVISTSANLTVADGCNATASSSLHSAACERPCSQEPVAPAAATPPLPRSLQAPAPLVPPTRAPVVPPAPAPGVAPPPAADGNAPPPTRVRRPPGRRVVRPSVEDVAEESGAEVSSRLHVANRSRDSGRTRPDVPAALPPHQQQHLPPGVVVGSRAGALSHSQVPSFPSTAGGSNAKLAAAFASLRGLTNGTNSQLPDLGLPPSLTPSQAPSLGPARASHGSGLGQDDDDECWHEVTALALKDPVIGEQALMIVQVDVTARVKAERQIAEVLEEEHKLLESVFPRHVLEAAAGQAARNAAGGGGKVRTDKYNLAAGVAQNCSSVATYHPMVTILFADIVGFTSMCHQIPATKVMEFLNNLYQRLDTLLDVYGVYKVETIGDCYMVAGGLMTRDADGFMTVRGSDSLDELHAAKVMSFAKAMLRETAEVLLPTTGQPVQMRIGLHSGPVMSGIVGSRMPRFCLFGDTVNTASRMESTCPPGSIHVSASTRDFLPHDDWEPTGGVQVKGKGMMDTFRWISPDADLASGPPLHGTAPSGRGRQRRASSVAYLQSGPSSSRDHSGSNCHVSKVLAHAAHAASSLQTMRSGPAGTRGEGPAAARGGSDPQAAAGAGVSGAGAAPPAEGSAGADADAAGGKCPRAASAGVAFGLSGPAAAAGEKASSRFPASVGASSTLLTRSGRRKPHRSCSTTAIAYMGLGKPLHS